MEYGHLKAGKLLEDSNRATDSARRVHHVHLLCADVPEGVNDGGEPEEEAKYDRDDYVNVTTLAVNVDGEWLQ